MREDAQNESLHYVQVYAVKDRVDFSAIPDCPSSAKNLYSILPTSDDYQILKENMAILVSRILVEHIRFFFVKILKILLPGTYHTSIVHKCLRNQKW